MSAAPFPIRPLALTAENFRGLGGEHALDLDRDLALIVGRNGTGKSSQLVAVEWCLFGAETTRKTGSGIAERGEWTLAHEGATGDVRVTLELAVEGGRARLTRRRPVDAKARAEDEVELELPDDEVLSGHEVEEWLAWNDMPDWSTWKRSFCQHQEQSRVRVTESADRSTAIAGMLGLEEHRKVNDDLKQLKTRKLDRRAAAALLELQEEQRRARERPGLLMHDFADRLAEHGLEVGGADEAELEARKVRLLADAAEIATRLRLGAERVPTRDEPAGAVLAWAREWPATVRRGVEGIARERVALSGRIQALEASDAALGPARGAETEARIEAERLAAELGSMATLRERQAGLAKTRAGLEEEQKRSDAVGKLVRDALEVVARAEDRRSCPVCDQERSDLEQVLRSKVDSRAPDALRGDLEQLHEREEEVRAEIGRVETAESAHAAARAQVQALEQRLRAQLPEGSDAEAATLDLLAAWRADERRAAESCEDAEQHVARHRRGLELLELLVQVRDARAGADTPAGALADTPEYRELERVVAAATSFASDIEALRTLARNLEDEQSEERINAVNESIDGYFATITGDSGHGRVRVQSKKTATKVTYQLVDAHGRPVTSLLNQAAFNALSLATLFASAESRAKKGLPRFLVLDDPGQSLDDDHQAGLARAIEKCASFAPVLLATVPGALADGLSQYSAR